MATVTLPDAYRAVLLAELVVIFCLYAWAWAHYVFDTRKIGDTGVQTLRKGAADRITGVLLILTVLIIAVLSAFGKPDIGRTLFNIIIQVALFYFFRAWLRVDKPRFLDDPPETDIAVRAVERMHRVSRRIEEREKS